MHVTIICDASYCPELKVAGYGYWIAAARGKLGGGARIASTNIRNSTVAEMMAVANSIAVATASQLVLKGDDVLIQTDCTGAIDAFRGLRVNLSPVEREVVRYVDDTIARNTLTIRYKHVKGHTNVQDARSITNRLCDKRAKEFLGRARIIARAQILKERLQS